MPRVPWLLALAVAACGTQRPGVPAVPEARDGHIAGAEAVRLHFRAYGAGADTVVLVHGQQGNSLEYLAPDLLPLARGRVLLAYTQRGGGRSDEVSEPERLGIDSHVRDLEALRQHFGLNRLALLAHSGGAGIAARYALAHPGRVERMLLVGAMPPARGPFYQSAMRSFVARFDSTELAHLQARQQALPTADDPAAVCRELHHTVLRRAYLVDPAALVRMRGDFCSAPPERLRTEGARSRAFQQSLGAWDWREELASIQAPVLIVHGARDAIPAAAAAAWAEALPDARVLVLPGADHFPWLDQPDEFFAAADGFLRGSWPPAAASP